MADNYLEKKMEEHRRGSAVGAYRKRLTPTGNRPGTVSLGIGELRVLVDNADDEIGCAIVRRLRSAGCKVAFVMADSHGGARLAQESGARFYPLSVSDSAKDDLLDAWGGLDVLVHMGANVSSDWLEADVSRILLVADKPQLPAVGGASPAVNAISVRCLSPDNVAHLCLLLCLDDSEFIKGRLFQFA